ncbi:hypothetical protein EBE87_20290 [Pseudoroseomonas wenyumeiae]|uniref:Uncharacterized protein n=1 Tax=Teichococcus wenyumeiae TaxID=2478470 RepID=A0A3A9JJ77_9PROT|nr:hypothetical protein [Pseudoroseomonas wenyumeiae]RKK04823.1 hypothetical protein D6Z83_07565 [Pseudoroseomonas wenyumeiae]RMI19491.1 hypothetical protein EBE87_20290 [Pseudoroseomonas wenyumeiae]
MSGSLRVVLNDAVFRASIPETAKQLDDVPKVARAAGMEGAQGLVKVITVHVPAFTLPAEPSGLQAYTWPLDGVLTIPAAMLTTANIGYVSGVLQVGDGVVRIVRDDSGPIRAEVPGHNATRGPGAQISILLGPDGFGGVVPYISGGTARLD